MESGKLRHRVSILSKSSTRDDFGGETLTWPLFGVFWANVEPVTMRQFIALRAAEVELDLKVTLRHRETIQPGWRLTWKGRTYEILSVVNPKGRNVSTELLCKGEVKP